MSTGIFHTRDLSKVTHKAYGSNHLRGRQDRSREEGKRSRRARQASKLDALRDEFAERLAESETGYIKDVAAALGISKAYGSKLFGQICAALGVPVKD